MKKEKTISRIPFIIIVAIIPLIVSGRQYNPELAENAWYSMTTASYDFFLFWKSRAIMVLGLVILLEIFYKMQEKEVRSSFLSHTIKNKTIMICLGSYAFLTFLSAVFAENAAMSFFGGYEQFEGALVLLTYVLVTCYIFYGMKESFSTNFFYLTVMVGTGIIAVLGLTQFYNYDFFRSELGKAMMRLMEPTLKGLDFNFNFEPGRVYLTLYNPNYVGSYVALLLPAVIGGIIVLKKLWQKIVMAVISVGLIISLIGSESMTGYVAVFLSILLLIIIMIPAMRRYWKVAFAVMGSGVLLAVLLTAIKPEVVEYAYNKIFRAPENDYAVQRFETNGDKLYVYSYDKKMEVKENAVITDDVFEGFTFTSGTYTTVNKKEYNGIKVSVDNHSWNFVLVNGKYKYFNVFQRIDEIQNIPAIGFEKNQHFGSRRGYIWSRTVPLVGEHILLGSGPDQFVLTFPNNDYVGLENNDYRGNILTKPHNMYLQIAVQTGLISLIAFLVFYFIYFIQSVRLYFRTMQYGIREITGMGIFLGTFGYMVTGFANDSSVTVAPIFWVLMGAGLAINHSIRMS